MGEVLPLPSRGEVYDDLRGEGRTLRVNWHPDERTLVLSIWRLGQCRATFRLPSEQVPDLVRSLVVAGLSEAVVQRAPSVQPVPLYTPLNAPTAASSGAAQADEPTVPVSTEARVSSAKAEVRPRPPAAVFLAPPAEHTALD